VNSVCGLGNLNSVPDVIFCDLIAFLVVGAQECIDKLVGDEALLMYHKILSIHFKTPTVTEATLQLQGSIN